MRMICANKKRPFHGTAHAEPDDYELSWTPSCYSAAKNFRMRSRPRSSSAFEVAYETRM